jgi:hypothetical protein
MKSQIGSFVGALTVLLLSGCSPEQTTPTALDEEAGLSAVQASAHGIAPPQSHPHGKSYSEWAAAWWQWILGIPVSINPGLDLTGEHCAVNQLEHVWFLAGSFSPGVVVRECTIPSGTALLFPLFTSGWFAFLNDPPEQTTEEFIRGQVTCVEGADIPLVEIDGLPVEDPTRYLEKSVVFRAVLPEDNLFGATEAQIPELTLFPSVDEGFYLFLNPLPPGPHTIRWQSRAEACGFAEIGDITYHLTVVPGHH